MTNHIKDALNSISESASGINGITAALIVDNHNFFDYDDDCERLNSHTLGCLHSGLQELATRIQTLSEQLDSQID